MDRDVPAARARRSRKNGQGRVWPPQKDQTEEKWAGSWLREKKRLPAAPSASYDVRLFSPLDSQQRKIQ
jgi:hypothetical protein